MQGDFSFASPEGPSHNPEGPKLGGDRSSRETQALANERSLTLLQPPRKSRFRFVPSRGKRNRHLEYIAMNTKASRKLSPIERQQRDLDIVALAREGWPYRDIGQKFELTKSRVSQIVLSLDPMLQLRQLETRHEVDEQKLLFLQLERRAETATICPIDGFWNLRGPHTVTCSPECSAVYLKVRDLIDPLQKARWRVSVAKGAMRSDNPVRIEWAKRVLAGEPQTRYYFHRHSKRRKIARVLGVLLVMPVVEARRLYP